MPKNLGQVSENLSIPTKKYVDDSFDILKIKSLIFSNVSIPIATWASDATYSKFPYSASITLAGVTSDYIPTVNFNYTEAISGEFAPVASTGSGTIIIYAASIPTSTITIPTIVCVK
jgi:hypothetical protein